MKAGPLLELSAERRAAEARRSAEREAATRAFDRARRRVAWQCVALTLSGVPLYLLSWHLPDPRQSNLAIAAAFFASYAVPWFRWLAYHLSTSEELAR